MKPFETGLRCQDVHAGLRGVDPNSAPLAHLEDTRLVGMAASLAAAIRGQDIVRDAQALKVVAADQLDVDSLAFNQVIELLDEAGFVNGVKRQGGKIQNFTEQVPFHQDLYSRLGEVWANREPTEVEGELLHTVHRLAAGPLPAEFPAHEVLGRADRWGMENLKNLDRFPRRGATVFVGLVPWEEGSGGPARVMAAW